MCPPLPLRLRQRLKPPACRKPSPAEDCCIHSSGCWLGRRGRGKTHVVGPGDCLRALFLPPHDCWPKAKLGVRAFGSGGQGETSVCALVPWAQELGSQVPGWACVPRWVLSSQPSGGAQGVAGAEQCGDSGLPGQGAKAFAPLPQIPLAVVNPSGDLQKRAQCLLRHKDFF